MLQFFEDPQKGPTYASSKSSQQNQSLCPLATCRRHFCAPKTANLASKYQRPRRKQWMDPASSSSNCVKNISKSVMFMSFTSLALAIHAFKSPILHTARSVITQSYPTLKQHTEVDFCPHQSLAERRVFGRCTVISTTPAQTKSLDSTHSHGQAHTPDASDRHSRTRSSLRNSCSTL